VTSTDSNPDPVRVRSDDVIGGKLTGTTADALDKPMLGLSKEIELDKVSILIPDVITVWMDARCPTSETLQNIEV